MIGKCYPDSGIMLEFTIADLLGYFSDIAQSHWVNWRCNIAQSHGVKWWCNIAESHRVNRRCNIVQSHEVKRQCNARCLSVVLCLSLVYVLNVSPGARLHSHVILCVTGARLHSHVIHVLLYWRKIAFPCDICVTGARLHARVKCYYVLCISFGTTDIWLFCLICETRQ